MESAYSTFLKKTKKEEGHKLICAQIRVGGKLRLNVNDKIFEIKTDAITQFYLNFIEKKFSFNIKNTKFSIYITSDSDEVKKKGCREIRHR